MTSQSIYMYFSIQLTSKGNAMACITLSGRMFTHLLARACPPLDCLPLGGFSARTASRWSASSRKQELGNERREEPASHTWPYACRPTSISSDPSRRRCTSLSCRLRSWSSTRVRDCTRTHPARDNRSGKRSLYGVTSAQLGCPPLVGPATTSHTGHFSPIRRFPLPCIGYGSPTQ